METAKSMAFGCSSTGPRGRLSRSTVHLQRLRNPDTGTDCSAAEAALWDYQCLAEKEAPEPELLLRTG